MLAHINILLMKWLYTNKNSFVLSFLIFYIFINFVFIYYRGYNTLLNKSVREFSTSFLLLKWHTHFLLKMYSLKFLYMYTMYADYIPSFQISPASHTGHYLPNPCSLLFLQHTETNYILSFMGMGLSTVVCATYW